MAFTMLKMRVLLDLGAVHCTLVQCTEYDINFSQWDYERIVLNVIDCFNFPQLFGFCLL